LPKSLISTAAVVLLALLGFAYVALSGSPRIGDFNYARFTAEGSSTAPVHIAVIEDLRCPSCRRNHLDVLQKVLPRYTPTQQAVVYYVPYPVTRSDSMALSVKALSYADFHKRPFSEISLALYKADSTRLSLDEAEALLAREFGPIAADARAALDAQSQERLREQNRYLSSIGIVSTPTVIVNGAVLQGPKAEVLAEYIEKALDHSRHGG
jgi:protein-disulfide isomerase